MFSSPPLAALAFAAGSVDAITYLALGHVFTANMTGNTVLLGIALTSGDAAASERSLLALGGFVLGAAVAARAISPARERAAWRRRTRAMLLLELAFLVALALVGAAALNRGGRTWLIGVSGMAMGLQSSTVWLARTAEVATTYITGTITGLVVRAAGSRAGLLAGSARSDLGRPAVIWLTYLVAALLAAAAARAVSLRAMWIAAATIAAVQALGLPRGR